MMNDRQKAMMNKLGLHEADFMPQDKEAMHQAETEMALCELAELVDNAITEHENALIELAELIGG